MVAPLEDIDILNEIDEASGSNVAADDESWSITDDSTADWALRRIAWHQAQIERRREFVQREMERLQAYLEAEVAKHQRSIQFFESHLRAYFEQLRAEGALGNRKTYRLPHGALQVRATQPKFERDNDQLLAWAKGTGDASLVRIREEPAWSVIKQRITIAPDGRTVIDAETGEVIPGVVVSEPAGETFDVKVEVDN